MAPLNSIYASSNNLLLCHASHSSATSWSQCFIIQIHFAITACGSVLCSTTFRYSVFQAIVPFLQFDNMDELLVYISRNEKVVGLASYLFSCSAEWSLFGKKIPLTWTFVFFIFTRWPLCHIDLFKMSASWHTGCSPSQPLAISLHLPRYTAYSTHQNPENIL